MERHVLAERHVAAVLMAAGAKKVTMPDLDEAWLRLDASLLAEPTARDDEHAELRRLMGLPA